MLESNEKQDPIEIAAARWRAPRPVATTRYLIDTAGRLQIDEELMDELARLKAAAQPASHHTRRRRDDRPGRGQRRRRDSMSGSKISGVILTKLD